jgi:hypothetical protein
MTNTSKCSLTTIFGALFHRDHATADLFLLLCLEIHSIVIIPLLLYSCHYVWRFFPSLAHRCCSVPVITFGDSFHREHTSAALFLSFCLEILSIVSIPLLLSSTFSSRRPYKRCFVSRHICPLSFSSATQIRRCIQFLKGYDDTV